MDFPAEMTLTDDPAKQKNQQERDLITRPHENSFMGEFATLHNKSSDNFLFKKQWPKILSWSNNFKIYQVSKYHS